MKDKDFFQLLLGEPPTEIKFEIELKIREILQLPDHLLREHCINLVRHSRLQDLILTAALTRVSEAEGKLYRLENKLQKYEQSSIFNKILYVLFGKRPKK